MKFLITGANGQLGNELIETIKKDNKHSVIGYGKQQLDITDSNRLKEVLQLEKPDCIINTAAFTNMDLCEKEQELAILSNGLGPYNLAAEAKKRGIKLFHISSGYVYSGEKFPPYFEEDPTDPKTIFGKSKKLGEELALQENKEITIIRTSWLFGHFGENFVKSTYDLSLSSKEIFAVNDQYGCPTYAKDLAFALLKLLQHPPGIYHVVNSGSCTWFEFAEEIIRIIGADTKVIPISSEQYGFKTRRPKYTLLSLEKIRKKGILMRHWREALQDYAKREFDDKDKQNERKKASV
ncbi:dTDP-4-dehydrorhamnose reductase [Bacillus gobiensis]|uniref:dTDP-4-dehydrorhamnose reductase n=1 Tax=Bacillus gobiensis TaxID=1441095 RepID=UPI003D1D9843